MSEQANPLLAMTGQYNLFESQGFKVGPAHGRVTGGLGEGQAPPKKKQGMLFGKSGKPGQMNLFPDKAVPDDLVAKPQRKKHALPAVAALAGKALPAVGAAMLAKQGLADRGEKIGTDLGGTLGGAGGALAAAKLKVPKKTAIATGTALGRKVGGKLGRKAGAALSGRKPPTRPQKKASREITSQIYRCKGRNYSLAESEAVRVAYENEWDDHQTNLAVALAGVELT